MLTSAVFRAQRGAAHCCRPSAFAKAKAACVEDAPDSTMALTAALQDLEFLVLADSTFQHLLNKDQYGSRTLFGGQALVCPGASLTQSYRRQGGITPSLLELLWWHCLRIHGLCPGNHPPYASPAVIQMLKDNMDRKINVALIPLGSSVPVSRQQHYDWLCQARDAYSLGHWKLTQQTILSLESGLSGPLYAPRTCCTFGPRLPRRRSALSLSGP